MGTVSSILDMIDLFPQKINFTYSQRSNFPTVCGGIFTLISLILVNVFANYVSKIFFDRRFPALSEVFEKFLSSPTITVYSDPIMKYYNGAEFLYDDQTEFNDDSLINKSFDSSTALDQIDVNYQFTTPFKFNYPYISQNNANDTFYYPIGVAFLMKNDFVDLDRSFFNLEVIHNSIRHKINDGRLFLYYSKCKRFFTFPKEVLLNSKMDKAYCLYDKFTLSGNEQTNDIEYLEFKFTRCNKSISKCKSDEEISKYIDDLRIYFFYTYSTIDKSSLTNVIKSNFANRYFEISSQLTKRCNIYISPNKIISYNSLIPEFLDQNAEINYALSEQSSYDQLEIQTEEDLSFLRIYLRAKLGRYVITRRYSDLLELFGIVGGMYRIITILISFMIIFYTQFRIKESLVNNFYSLTDPRNEKFIERSYPDYLLWKFGQYGLVNGQQIIGINNRFYDDDANNGLNKYFNKNKILYIFGLFLKIVESSYGNVYNNTEFDFDDAMLNHFTDLNIKNIDHSDCIREVKKYEIIYNSIKNSSYEKMYFSFLEVLGNFFLPNYLRSERFKNKCRIFENACSKLKNDTDFLRIIKSIKELAILKTTFFSDQQIKLFKFVSNKPITEDDVKKNRIIMDKTISKTKQQEIEEYNQDIIAEELQEYQANEKMILEHEFNAVLKSDNDCKKAVELEKALNFIVKNRSLSRVDNSLLKNMNVEFSVIQIMFYSRELSFKKHLFDYKHVFDIIVKKCEYNSKNIKTKLITDRNSNMDLQVYNDDEMIREIEMKVLELNSLSDKKFENVGQQNCTSNSVWNSDNVIVLNNMNDKNEILKKINITFGNKSDFSGLGFD